jgi:hypothetical protein
MLIPRFVMTSASALFMGFIGAKGQWPRYCRWASAGIHHDTTTDSAKTKRPAEAGLVITVRRARKRGGALTLPRAKENIGADENVRP